MPPQRPVPSSRVAPLGRRTVLLGALGTTTLACSPYELQTQRRRPRPRPTPSTVDAPPTDPDVQLARGVVAAERALLDQLDATARRHPALERFLAAGREVHTAHLTLLEDAVPEGSEPSAAPDPASPSASTGPSPTPTPARVPRDRARALRAVAAAEDALALTAKQAAFAAQSGAFARVLASLAASSAQRSAVLRTARVGGGRR
ncbi:MAG TPA: hypothetical protein VFV40_05615 [Nocardioides sp.]|nr:hypothetical protein [Nocardioides sp.]